MRSSPISDPLDWLVASSEGCLCPGSVDRLLLASMGGRCRGGFVVEACSGLRFYVPCSHVEWAWASIVHVACLDDYGVLRLGLVRGVVVDAGGGFGVFAAAAAQAGAERVYVLEPASVARRLVEDAAAALGLEGRVVVLPYALAGGSGRRRLLVAGNVVNSSLVEGYPSSRGVDVAGVEEVEAVTFSRLLGLLGVERVDLLKLDVEGLEVEILEDMAAGGGLERVGCAAVEAHSRSAWLRVRVLLSGPGMRLLWLWGDDEFHQYFATACWPSRATGAV